MGGDAQADTVCRQHTAGGGTHRHPRREAAPLYLMGEHAPFAEIIQACWAQDAEHRPTMSKVVETLMRLEGTWCPLAGEGTTSSLVSTSGTVSEGSHATATRWVATFFPCLQKAHMQQPRWVASVFLLLDIPLANGSDSVWST